ncbi:MAG: LURP-one-related/scramblase family protein [Promethearchaeota archaeon]
MLTSAREFLIKEQIFTLNERMEIMDPSSQAILGYFKSKFFTLPKKYWLTYPDDRPLIGIEKQIFTFLPKFDFFEAQPNENLSSNRLLGTLEKKFSFFTPKYYFKAPNGAIMYEIQGNLWERSFQVFQQGRIVAEISKKFWSWSDTYGIRIDPNRNDQEAMVLLTMVVVLDYIADQQKQHNH